MSLKEYLALEKRISDLESVVEKGTPVPEGHDPEEYTAWRRGIDDRLAAIEEGAAEQERKLDEIGKRVDALKLGIELARPGKRLQRGGKQ